MTILFNRLVRDILIQSALIWATTIITCAAFMDTPHVSSILITAAGFHVILMSTHKSRKQRS